VNKQKPTETTEARQPRPVYYEPDHDGDALDTIAAVLHLRGYRLTSDESFMDDFTKAHAMVTVEGNGSLTLHDGDTVTDLPHVEEFADAQTYALAVADWLDGDEKYSPAERAEAARTWTARRDEANYRIRAMRRILDRLDRNVNHDTPTRFRSGSPATTAKQDVEDIVEQCQRLVRELTEEVPADLVESARVDRAGVEALAVLSQAVRGGVR